MGLYRCLALKFLTISINFNTGNFDALNTLQIHQINWPTLHWRDQGIVYNIGPHNRHWGAFADNRTIWQDTKGRSQSCIFSLWWSKSHAVYCTPLCFISDGVLIWGRCQKCLSVLIIMGIWQVGRLRRWSLGVVPAIIYHCNTVLVVHVNSCKEDSIHNRDMISMWYLWYWRCRNSNLSRT